MNYLSVFESTYKQPRKSVISLIRYSDSFSSFDTYGDFIQTNVQNLSLAKSESLIFHKCESVYKDHQKFVQ